MTRLVFLDTETTGLSHEGGDRIIEIGCIEMVNRRLTGRSKHFYVNPQRANSDDALKVHGLSDEFLADKPLFGAVADELAEFLSGAEIVIHNAPFDVGFMDAELQRLGTLLDGLAVDASPFDPGPPRPVARVARWVRPELVAEVEFAEWTDDGILRHPSYLGLRGDKAPTDVVREG